MTRVERFREVLSGSLDFQSLQKRIEEGWRLVALEWEHIATTGERSDETWKEEIPYGLRVASDCLHLEEDPVEREILEKMLTLIAADKSMSKVAEALNREGFRTRKGLPWSQAAVFDMLPRLIEAAPRLHRLARE
jgi:Recombinase